VSKGLSKNEPADHAARCGPSPIMPQPGVEALA
jgi:hypothetical protein